MYKVVALLGMSSILFGFEPMAQAKVRPKSYPAVFILQRETLLPDGSPIPPNSPLQKFIEEPVQYDLADSLKEFRIMKKRGSNFCYMLNYPGPQPPYCRLAHYKVRLTVYFPGEVMSNGKNFDICQDESPRSGCID